MVVVSTLRAAGVGNKLVQTALRRASANLLNKQNVISRVPVRHMGEHKRVMDISPSKFEWTQWKDTVHLYVMMAAIPITLIIGYANLFIGPAELAEVPEDHTPKHWEYYKHPISRFLAKHFHRSPEMIYEVNLHQMYVQEEKRRMRLLEKKVKQLSAERQDAKNWMFIPIQKDQQIYAGYEAQQREKETFGRSG